MSKKLVSILLAVVLVLASAGAAFAWTSFQNHNYLNNGIISDTSTYPTSSPTVNVYTSLTAGGWAGVDCSPLVNVENNVPYAYVLHAGSGGAKLAKVRLDSPTTTLTGWPTDGVSVNTSGGFQLSTPIIVNDTIYFAGNVYGNIVLNHEFDDYVSPDFPNWTITPGTGVSYTQATITLTDSTTKKAIQATASGTGNYTISAYQGGLNILNSQLAYLRIAGGLQFSNVSSATVTVTVNGTSKVFGYNDSDPNKIPLVEDNGIYCWNENMSTSSATTNYMQVTIDYTTTAANGCVYLDYASLYEQSSGIGKIANISTTTTPTVEDVVAGIVGQINTPISSDGTYIYFGTYTTNGKYYRVNISNNNAKTFNMTGNSTYWAGAAVCGDYLVFGTEKGILYSVNKNDMSTKKSKTLSPSSYIRSSICAVADGSNYKLYFTSRTGSTGYLWCYTLSSNGNLSENWHYEVGYTNSTPVVSGSYVYVGSSSGVTCVNTSGALQWTTAGNSTFSAITSVQASPIVYSVAGASSTTDYIYVTTNLSNGQGYCISSVQGSSTPSLEWSTSVATGATYALQGFAAGGGYMVFGNDYSNLIIVH